MRTNIDIDDRLMEDAMKAGPYKTKKDAVEAGLLLLARQVAYREILKWEGKLKWEGDDSVDWTAPESAAVPPSVAPSRPAARSSELVAAEPAARYGARGTGQPAAAGKSATATSKRRAGR